MAVWTAEKPDNEAQFEAFHRDILVASLRESPHFLRARVYRQKSGFEANDRISSPYLFMQEWDSDELPWTELVEAAMTNEWQEMIESGFKYQGGCYHIQSVSKRGDVLDGKTGDSGVEVKIDGPQN